MLLEHGFRVLVQGLDVSAKLGSGVLALKQGLQVAVHVRKLFNSKRETLPVLAPESEIVRREESQYRHTDPSPSNPPFRTLEPVDGRLLLPPQVFALSRFASGPFCK